METPLIVSLSRQISVKDQMSVIGNNIANMSTGGYKAERMMFKDFVANTQSGDTVVFPQQAGIHRMYNPGPIERTTNPLDIALRGDGYLVAETPAGPRYTRNGHLNLDSKGQLVTSQGFPVLGEGDRPIVFGNDTKQITISEDRSISADGNELGKLKVVKFDNPQALKREGGTLFKTDAPPVPTTDVEVAQGYLEGSNVQPIIEITRFMNATGSYQSSKKVIDDEHDRQRRAIQQLGSIPE